MSKNKLIIDHFLLNNNKSSDKEIADELNFSIYEVQTCICKINFDKGKYKEFSILKSGKVGDLSRELITKNSNENDLINSADENGKKALKELDMRRKKIVISLNSRQGQINRMKLMQNLLSQNLNLSIEVQKLLQ